MTSCFDRKCSNRYCNPNKEIIFLFWKDASYQTGSCLDVSDLKPEIVIVTSGILIQETETHYSIALDHYPDQCTWRQVEHIPKINVVRVYKAPWPFEE